ncbi:hypothetical protein [Caenimonas aquaedulcis]|uniref:Uncharacterized protein n=1 Tax=Caenimonas aquaedulcis TaxID=2793270 RepID=A0A931H3C5_9BURK|nr:hypothetical protein [Caenimonas aquaedulcis]MBG9387787.1 hypothetical protein [Caenimonas aquaedulcis]
MKTWLAIAAISAMLAACAQQPVAVAVEQPADEGTVIAASLGYHGPVARPSARAPD